MPVCPKYNIKENTKSKKIAIKVMTGSIYVQSCNVTFRVNMRYYLYI